MELIGSLEKLMFHTWVNPECILAITVSLCLHGSRYTLLFVLVCAQVIKLSLSGSQSDTYWIVTIKHSGEPELSALWVFCQCYHKTNEAWYAMHWAELRQQVSHGFTLCLPETLTALVISHHALGMTVLLFRALLLLSRTSRWCAVIHQFYQCSNTNPVAVCPSSSAQPCTRAA